MSYLAEWQKQQKALKDAERERSKRASLLRHTYRGGEHDIKHQRQQKMLRDVERQKMLRASSFRHKYRGGEHDIKHQQQQKILRDTQRKQMMKASSFRRKYKGGEHDILQHQQHQKARKDAERKQMKRASLLRHTYKGGEYDITKHEQQHKARKDAERKQTKRASLLRHTYKGGEHDLKDYERAVIEQRKKNIFSENDGRHLPLIEPMESSSSSLELSSRDNFFESPPLSATASTTDFTEGNDDNSIKMSISTSDGKQLCRESSQQTGWESFLSFPSEHFDDSDGRSDATESDKKNTDEIERVEIHAIEEGITEEPLPIVLNYDQTDDGLCPNESVSNIHNDDDGEDDDDSGNNDYDFNARHSGYYDWTAHSEENCSSHTSSTNCDSSSGSPEKTLDSVNNDHESYLYSPYHVERISGSSRVTDGESATRRLKNDENDNGRNSICNDYYDLSSVSSAKNSDSEADNSRDRSGISTTPSSSCINNNHCDSNFGNHDETPKRESSMAIESSTARALQMGVDSTTLDDYESASSSDKSDSNRGSQLQGQRRRNLSLRGIMFDSDILESATNTRNNAVYGDASLDYESARYTSKVFRSNPENCSDTRRKIVRFVDEEDDSLLKWWDSDYCHSKHSHIALKNSSGVLDIYNESMDSPYNEEGIPNDNFSKADLYRDIYTEEMEDTSDCEYDSEEEDRERNAIRGFLFSMGDFAVSNLISGITRLQSAVRNSKDESTGENKVFSGGELAEDAVHTVEFAADSASNAMTTSMSSLSGSSSMNATMSATSSTVTSTSTSMSASASSTSASAVSMASSTSTSAAAVSSAASASSASTASMSAAASSASISAATSSASLASVTASSMGATAAGQATAVAAQ
jgi:hypothetical protein